MEQIQDHQSNTKNGDEDSHVKIWLPVLDDHARGSEICRQQNHVLEEVIPPCCKTKAGVNESRSIASESLFHGTHRSHLTESSDHRPDDESNEQKTDQE